MSTCYKIAEGVELIEASTKVRFFVFERDVDVESPELDAKQLRRAIIKQIEVLSYISDNPQEALNRFNVDYGQEE